jgi:hypothetical protein
MHHRVAIMDAAGCEEYSSKYLRDHVALVWIIGVLLRLLVTGKEVCGVRLMNLQDVFLVLQGVFRPDQAHPFHALCIHLATLMPCQHGSQDMRSFVFQQYVCPVFQLMLMLCRKQNKDTLVSAIDAARSFDASNPVCSVIDTFAAALPQPASKISGADINTLMKQCIGPIPLIAAFVQSDKIGGSFPMFCSVSVPCMHTCTHDKPCLTQETQFWDAYNAGVSAKAIAIRKPVATVWAEWESSFSAGVDRLNAPIDVNGAAAADAATEAASESGGKRSADNDEVGDPLQAKRPSAGYFPQATALATKAAELMVRDPDGYTVCGWLFMKHEAISTASGVSALPTRDMPTLQHVCAIVDGAIKTEMATYKYDDVMDVQPPTVLNIGAHAVRIPGVRKTTTLTFY